jgi:hypothetical protein
MCTQKQQLRSRRPRHLQPENPEQLPKALTGAAWLRQQPIVQGQASRSQEPFPSGRRERLLLKIRMRLKLHLQVLLKALRRQRPNVHLASPNPRSCLRQTIEGRTIRIACRHGDVEDDQQIEQLKCSIRWS